ncbi:unnamed protein product, partial [Gulo gulo]
TPPPRSSCRVSSRLFLSPTQCWELGQRQRLNRSSGVRNQRGQRSQGPRVLLGPDAGAMLSGERKEGGSPRFGKLHLPVGLWINSPRKQLAKLGRRWPSAASVK